MFLASLGFRRLSATFCASSSPSSSHANTCLFGSYHLCNSDCNSSHGNHRKASIFIVSICFHLFIKVIYCKLYFHLLRIKSIQYWDTVLFCFVLFVLKRPTQQETAVFRPGLSLKQSFLTFLSFSSFKGKILHTVHPHQKQLSSTVLVFCSSYLVHLFCGWQAGPIGSAPQQRTLKF